MITNNTKHGTAGSGGGILNDVGLYVNNFKFNDYWKYGQRAGGGKETQQWELLSTQQE
jgi:hypothetical protein